MQLASEVATGGHNPVIRDMLDTGCLVDIQGALVACDRLIDEGDAGRIHTVIAGGVSNAVVDIKTGDTAFRDAD